MEKKTRIRLVEVTEEYYVANDGAEFETVEQCLLHESKKNKYPVNVVFDGELEPAIRERAKEFGVGVATYIKMLVNQDINQK